MNTLCSLDMLHQVHVLNQQYCSSIEKRHPQYPLAKANFEYVASIVSTVVASLFTGLSIVSEIYNRHVLQRPIENHQRPIENHQRIFYISRKITSALLLGLTMRVTTIGLTALTSIKELFYVFSDINTIREKLSSYRNVRLLDSAKCYGLYLKTYSIGFLGSIGAIIAPELLFTKWGINLLQWQENARVQLDAELLRLEDPPLTCQIALWLVQNTGIESQLKLFNRINEMIPLPQWYTGQLKVEFLNQLLKPFDHMSMVEFSRHFNYPEYKRIVEALIQQMDDTDLQAFYAKTNKSLLHIALEQNFSLELTTKLFQKLFLYTHKNDSNYILKSIFKKSLLNENPHLSTILNCFGLTSVRIGEDDSYDIEGSVDRKVLFLLLVGKPQQIVLHTQQLSFIDKIALLEQIDLAYDRAVVLDLIPYILEINKSHLQRDVGQIQVPENNPNTPIDTLAELYQNSIPDWSYDIYWRLQIIVDTIKNNAQILGAPADGNERAAQYKPIRNAACSVLHTFKEQIARLRNDHEGKSLKTLVADGIPQAQELVSLMKSFFEECQEAAGFCFPRLSSTIINEYQRIVLGQVDGTTIETKILRALAMHRNTIVQRMAGNNSQNVHRYNDFMQRFGMTLGIPGAQVIARQNDIFVPRHNNDIAQAIVDFRQLDEFYKEYKQDCVSVIESICNKNKQDVTDFLKDHIPQQWVKEEKERIFAHVEKLWKDNTIDLQTRKNNIEKHLAGEPYFFTVDANDLASLENLRTAIIQDESWRIFIALSQKEGKYRPWVIAYLLCQLHVFQHKRGS